ncbi:hypothetical protein [Bacillus mycoides]|uniref:hypothetical protein n=1 Tax=Bacillus mycoides TaxID=1405 RepID=UPI003D660477
MPIKQVTSRDVSIQLGKGDVVIETFEHERKVGIEFYEAKDKPWTKSKSTKTYADENLDKPSVMVSFDKIETLEAFIEQLQDAVNTFKSKENL